MSAGAAERTISVLHPRSGYKRGNKYVSRPEL
jgi:hypothetical protein